LKKYHMRRPERRIKERKRMLELLDGKDHVTIAMSKDNVPYLVTVNHYFDKKGTCIYFHCASKGKKMDYMKANPFVWGQVMDDLGPVEGECDQEYRTVMFRGKVSFVESMQEKKHALDLMIDRLSSRPARVKSTLTGASLDKVAICRIDLLEMTGKECLAKKK
jgi:nitroimidazol reductase NimA-like FMN-containing flavoprotein (pyridoxamine 5'-phosphate oxidase superfamily)